MKRLCLLAVSAALLGAAPAGAHEEINPSTVTVGTPVFLTLTAANEKTVGLSRIAVTAPQALSFGEATRDPAGWSSTRTDTALTWTGGSLAPGRFESWGYEIEGAEQPGPLSYKVTLGYADGTSEDATVVVTATAASAAVAARSSDPSSARANVALTLAVVSLALAALALGLASRAGGGRRAAPEAGPAGAEQDW